MQPPGSPRPGMDGLFQREIRRRLSDRYFNEGGYGLPPVLLQDLNQWQKPGQGLYWVGEEETIRRHVPHRDKLEILDRIEIEEIEFRPPPQPIGGPPPGGPGGRGPRQHQPLGSMPGQGAEGGAVVVRWERNR